MTTVTVTANNYVASGSFAGPGPGLTSLLRSAISAGTPNQIVVNDGVGALSSISTIDTARGGTGIDSSALTGIVQISAGTWSAGSVDGADISGNIARTKLTNGPANHVLINDGAGVISSEAALDPARGGTGVDTSASSGIARVTTGTWSVGTVTNSDIDASANIARSKIAAGVADHVVINSGTGTLSSEAQLSVARGGTGGDFSGVGAGPFVLELSLGAFAATAATASAVPNTYVKRNGSADVSFSTVNLTGISSSTNVTITATNQLNIVTPLIDTGASIVTAAPASIPGGRVTTYINNLQTGDATFTTILSVPTSPGASSGTAYTCNVALACGDRTGGTASALITFKFRAKNVGGVLTVGGVSQILRQREAPLSTVNAQTGASGTNIVVQVRGIVGSFVDWSGRLEIVSQEY